MDTALGHQGSCHNDVCAIFHLLLEVDSRSKILFPVKYEIRFINHTHVGYWASLAPDKIWVQHEGLVGMNKVGKGGGG